MLSGLQVIRWSGCQVYRFTSFQVVTFSSWQVFRFTGCRSEAEIPRGTNREKCEFGPLARQLAGNSPKPPADGGF